MSLATTDSPSLDKESADARASGNASSGLGVLVSSRQFGEDQTRDNAPSAATPPGGGWPRPNITTTTTNTTNPDMTSASSEEAPINRLFSSRVFANPAPVGLCAFALTSFTSSVVNVCLSKDNLASDVVIASSFGYGGIVQILVGMWELARGNTFNATAFCSYGAFWVTSAIVSALGKLETLLDRGNSQSEEAMGLFMMAWFILTTLLLLCTLKSNIALFLLFFFLDLNYLLLGITHLQSASHVRSVVHFRTAGELFGLLAALAAWYNALAGIMNSGNSFYTIPIGHFPWSPLSPRHQLKSDKVM